MDHEVWSTSLEDRCGGLPGHILGKKRGVGNIRVCKKAVIRDITLLSIRTFLFRVHKSCLSHKTCSVHLSFGSMIFEFARNDESQLNVINRDVSRTNNSTENITLAFVTFEIGFCQLSVGISR